MQGCVAALSAWAEHRASTDVQMLYLVRSIDLAKTIRDMNITVRCPAKRVAICERTC